MSDHRMNPHVHAQFHRKKVFRLHCRHCTAPVCVRGMKAILLADAHIELFSTDVPPTDAVHLLGEEYLTRNCSCRIRDVACLTCGNVVGYHVVAPCCSCLQASNNGHFWMYHSDQIVSSERLDPGCKAALRWGHIPRAAADEEIHIHRHHSEPRRSRSQFDCCR